MHRKRVASPAYRLRIPTLLVASRIASGARASSCFICQLKGTSIVRLHDGCHVHGDDLAVPNHDFAIDDGGSGLLRSAEENCRHGVMQGTGITDGMEIE